jgi:Tfp pilus assembly protein PilF
MSGISNPLENPNLSEEEKIREGVNYLSDVLEGKITLQEISGMKDSDINAIIAVGVLMYQQGRRVEAEDLFRGAVLLNRKSALAHSALGTVLTAEGKYDEALVELSEAIALDSTDIAAYVNRGEIYLKQADFKGASEDLRKAVELDPDQSDPAANRARAIIVGINEMVKELQNQIDQGQEPVL